MRLAIRQYFDLWSYFLINYNNVEKENILTEGKKNDNKKIKGDENYK